MANTVRRFTAFTSLALAVACQHSRPIEVPAPPAVLVLRAQAAVEDSTIRGMVISDDHRTRIAEARLELGDTPLRVTSAADGRFTLYPVPPGRHVLRVYRVGYEKAEQTIEMPSARGAAIVVFMAVSWNCLDSCGAPPPPRRSTIDNVPRGSE